GGLGGGGGEVVGGHADAPLAEPPAEAVCRPCCTLFIASGARGENHAARLARLPYFAPFDGLAPLPLSPACASCYTSSAPVSRATQHDPRPSLRYPSPPRGEG